MGIRGPISEELRRSGIAAETIRSALSGYILQEPEKLTARLAQCKVSLEDFMALQADAKAYMRLKFELDLAISNGSIED